MDKKNVDNGILSCVVALNKIYMQTGGYSRSNNIAGKAIMDMLDSTDEEFLKSLIGEDIKKWLFNEVYGGVNKKNTEEMDELINGFLSSEENFNEIVFEINPELLPFSSPIRCFDKPYKRFYHCLYKLNLGLGCSKYSHYALKASDSNEIEEINKYLKKYISLAI